jgi:hypothetical protein
MTIKVDYALGKSGDVSMGAAVSFKSPQKPASSAAAYLNDNGELTLYSPFMARMHQPIRDVTDHDPETGTARLKDLESLVAWANRFKGDSSGLFANPVMDTPSLTCIADYHDEGPADPTNPLGDPSARHGHHRGIYDFPLSEDWKAWMAVSDTPLEKDDMGEFTETQAKNIMDPTPAIIAGVQDDANDDWENRLIETACKIEGRYGQLTQLLQMSKQFLVNETSDLKLTTNRDTGEAEMKFINEHKGLNGQPLNLPNLIIIAIPVFLNGPLYRMPVRFRYRKSGGQVKFILSIYNPEKAFEASFDESLELAVAHTDLPLFKGTPMRQQTIERRTIMSEIVRISAGKAAIILNEAPEPWRGIIKCIAIDRDDAFNRGVEVSA